MHEGNAFVKQPTISGQCMNNENKFKIKQVGLHNTQKEFIYRLTTQAHYTVHIIISIFN